MAQLMENPPSPNPLEYTPNPAHPSASYPTAASSHLSPDSLFLQLIKEKLLDLLGKEEEDGSHDENVVRREGKTPWGRWSSSHMCQDPVTKIIIRDASAPVKVQMGPDASDNNLEGFIGW